jgi:hypothetical protein
LYTYFFSKVITCRNSHDTSQTIPYKKAFAILENLQPLLQECILAASPLVLHFSCKQASSSKDFSQTLLDSRRSHEEHCHTTIGHLSLYSTAIATTIKLAIADIVTDAITVVEANE